MRIVGLSFELHVYETIRVVAFEYIFQPDECERSISVSLFNIT